jgi:hypothetical protein
MDTYFSTDKAVFRLFNEWKKHPKLLVACDFDDTVFDFHKQGTSHTLVFELLKKCKALGFYVTLFTASKPERHDEMREYMKQNGIEIDAINQNPIPMPYGNHGKIYYNILLDDRAGLGQAYTTLLTVVRLAELELEDVALEQNKPAA